MAEARQQNHILLNQSGCLTQMACRHYSNNKLSGEFLMVVEDHLRSCEMCRDAVEGMGMISPNKFSDQTMQHHITSVEDRVDSYAAQYKSKQKNKQRRMIYISGLAASIVVFLAVLVTVQYDQFQNIELFAQHSVEEVPIDEFSIELAAFEGQFHAPVKDLSDRSEAGFPPTRRNQSDKRPEKRETTSNTEKTPMERGQRQPSHEGSGANQDQPEPATGRETEDETLPTPDDADVVATENDPVDEQQVDNTKDIIDEKESAATNDHSLPAFAGEPGTEKFKKYLSSEYYQQQANDDGAKPLTGIEISGTVNENGKIGEINIENATDREQEKLLRRIMTRSPRWIPAEQNGEKVKQRIEIRFTAEQ